MWSSILKPKQNELRFLVMMLCGVMLLAQACCLSPDQWAYWSLSACCSPRHAAPTGMLLPLGNLDMLLPGQNAAPFPGHTAPQACCSPWAMWVCWLPSHGMLLLLGLMLPPPLAMLLGQKIEMWHPYHYFVTRRISLMRGAYPSGH
jgi:hypothetical protein